jgi:Ca-activated chloride channel homolog
MELVRLASPWVLLALVPAWAGILYFSFGAGKRRAGAAGRAALACLAAGFLVVALAGPALRTSRLGERPVVVAEDVSGSMTPRGPHADPAAVLAPFTAALPHPPVATVRFGSASETHIEAALMTDAARQLEGPGIILLYSDGLETDGNALAAATALAARGIQVHAVVPPIQPRDVRIEDVEAPDTVPAGQPVRLTVRVASTVPADAVVAVTRQSAVPDPPPPIRLEQKVTLGPAAPAVLVFEDAPPFAGTFQYDIAVTSDADDWPENDRASRTVLVGDQPTRVSLLHEGDPPQAFRDRLQALLPKPGNVVCVRAADFRPQESGADVILLDNVSAVTLGQDRAESLARLVTDGGVGLLVLGGDASFAAGGYGGSPLDDLLPVTSRTGKRPPLEIVFVVDSSGSMNETVGEHRKLTLAKQAVLALRPMLAEGDRVGIVAFAGEPRVASPLAPVSDWDLVTSRLREVEAGGGTRLTPAVETAVGLFGPRPADSRAVRHVLLLSDGRSEDFDLARLVPACQGAGVSVSAVATGADADAPRLTQLASDTGGRLFLLRDLSKLPEVFLKDLTLTRGEGLQATSLPVQWNSGQPIWQTAGGPLPSVEAFNPTEAKKDADVLWSASAGDGKAVPILAVWRRGLGRVAAMPWPVDQADKTRLDDRLKNIIDWLQTVRTPTDWSTRLVARGNHWWVRVEEKPEAIGRSQEPFIATWEPGTKVQLEQVAPGLHEANLGAVGRKPWGLIYVSRAGDDRGREVLSPPADTIPYEFKRFGADRARLEAIVRAGGGQILTDPDSLARIVAQAESRDYLPVGVYLAGAALAAVLLGIGLRLRGRL